MYCVIAVILVAFNKTDTQIYKVLDNICTDTFIHASKRSGCPLTLKIFMKKVLFALALALAAKLPYNFVT